MANKPVKYNRNQNTRSTPKSDTDTWKHNWAVMKPFVYFGFKAMTIIGGALISIVKLLPSLLDDHQVNKGKKSDKVIKI